MTTRVLSGGGQEECSAWVPPAVASSVPATAALTPAELDALRKRAEAEGFEAGRRQGLDAAHRELRESVARLDTVLQALSRPFSEVESVVEQELIALAFAIARQLVRRELKMDPLQIVGVVRDGLRALPVAARDVKVHLNPDDAQLVRQHLPSTDQERAWSIVEDPMLARGGARISTSSAQVDARLETRLGALFAEIVGGDRQFERSDAEEDPPP